MLVERTTQASPVEFSRCSERSRFRFGEQNTQTGQDHTDILIAEQVDRALWNNGTLRSTDYRQIDVFVKDGAVFLSGHVSSTGNQISAENAARTTSGAAGVHSSLFSDDKIVQEVAGALGKIEHTYGVKFFTGAQNGVIVLNGEVSDIKVRSLAEKCAANIPGVRGVINWVRIPGFNLDAEDHRFLQPAIGEEIYIRDGLTGKVKNVIINPNNLRVVAMVVKGRYSPSQQDPRLLTYGEDRTPERLIVVPMSAIRFLTKSNGYLHNNSAEAAQYSDFDPSDYTAPREDWTPPYPYCPDDVLFLLESLEE